CLPLDASPRGHLRALVGEIARLAGLDGEAPALLRAIVRLTSRPQFDSVVGARDQRLPLIVDGGCLYTERSRWLEDRVARRSSARPAGARRGWPRRPGTPPPRSPRLSPAFSPTWARAPPPRRCPPSNPRRSASRSPVSSRSSPAAPAPARRWSPRRSCAASL